MKGIAGICFNAVVSKSGYAISLANFVCDRKPWSKRPFFATLLGFWRTSCYVLQCFGTLIFEKVPSPPPQQNKSIPEDFFFYAKRVTHNSQEKKERKKKNICFLDPLIQQYLSPAAEQQIREKKHQQWSIKIALSNIDLHSFMHFHS